MYIWYICIYIHEKKSSVKNLNDILNVSKFQHLTALVCRHLICHLSTFRRFAHCLSSRIYFSCSHHKQLNGDLNGIPFVMLAVHAQVALMSSFLS